MVLKGPLTLLHHANEVGEEGKGRWSLLHLVFILCDSLTASILYLKNVFKLSGHKIKIIY